MLWKNALDVYVTNPESVRDGTVIHFDDDAVIIHDKFPKSTFHLLILPRDPHMTKTHPAVAEIKDPLSKYIEIATDYVYNNFWQQYRLNKADDWAELQDKEVFIERFVQVGVHSVPSMSNLHVHVMTKDFNSLRLKNKKHYNSFNTAFFINWDQLPLERVPDTHAAEQIVKSTDMKCCYCGKNYSNKFSLLKKHLDDEFTTHFSH